MEKRLIITPSKEIRRQAREILSGKWVIAAVMFAAVMLMIIIPSAIIMNLMVPEIDPYSYDYSWLESFYAAIWITILLALVISGLFETGLLKAFLDAARGGKFEFGSLTYAFAFAGKAIGLVFVMFFFIFLWTLLLIVPGIIAGFRYSQAIYLLIDDPSKGIMQCIRESKEMMNGNKMKLFCLSLSFIGWAILAVIPSVLFESFYTGNPESAGFMVIDLVLMIPEAFLYVYMITAMSRFYQMLIGERDADVAVYAEDVYTLGNPAGGPLLEEQIENTEAAAPSEVKEEEIPESEDAEKKE